MADAATQSSGGPPNDRTANLTRMQSVLSEVAEQARSLGYHLTEVEVLRALLQLQFEAGIVTEQSNPHEKRAKT